MAAMPETMPGAPTGAGSARHAPNISVARATAADHQAVPIAHVRALPGTAAHIPGRLGR